MSIRLRLQSASVLRCRADLRQRSEKIRRAVFARAEDSMLPVAKLTEDKFPVGTGQARSGVRVIAGTRSGGNFDTGVGIAKTRNGQEIKIERGTHNDGRKFVPHTDTHSENCSKGVEGNWGDFSETENAQKSHGGLQLNENAAVQPLGKAVVQLHGNVIDSGANRGFRKGQVNHYPSAGALSGGTGDSKLKKSLQSACVAALAVILLLGFQTTHAQVLNHWDRANIEPALFNTDTLLYPLQYKKSRPIEITDQTNSAQFFQLFYDASGYGASQGNSKIAIFVTTGRDSSTATIPLEDPLTGDTLWSLKGAQAVASLNPWNLPLLVQGGLWMKIWYVNLSGGDTVSLPPERNWLWMKH